MTKSGMFANVLLILCLALLIWGASCCVEAWALWIPGLVVGGLGLTGCILVLWSNKL